MTTVEIQQAVVPKLPIWQTVKAAYRDSFGNPSALLTAAAIPFVLSLLLDTAMPAEAGDLGSDILRLVLDSVAVALFEITWFRHLMLGGDAGRPGPLPAIDRRLRLFLCYTLLLSLLFVPNLLVEKLVGPAVQLAPHLLVPAVFLLAASSYLFVRFAFVSLWIAVDAPERLGESWRYTRRNGLRILVAVVLVAVPILLPLFGLGIVLAIVAPELAARLESGSLDGGALWLHKAGSNILLYLYYALSCAALVRAFGLLTGWLGDRRALLERFD